MTKCIFIALVILLKTDVIKEKRSNSCKHKLILLIVYQLILYVLFSDIVFLLRFPSIHDI